MNYISGGELFSLVDEYGCLPEKVVRIYVAEIALAIGRNNFNNSVSATYKIRHIFIQKTHIVYRFSTQRWCSTQRSENNQYFAWWRRPCGDYRLWSGQMVASHRTNEHILWNAPIYR